MQSAASRTTYTIQRTPQYHEREVGRIGREASDRAHRRGRNVGATCAVAGLELDHGLQSLTGNDCVRSIGAAGPCIMAARSKGTRRRPI